MEYYVPLEITLISAEGVVADDDVGFPSLDHMELFAVVTLIAGDAVFAMQRTPTVSTGSAEDQRNAAWNFAVRFSIPRGGCDSQKLRFDLWRRCSHGDHGMIGMVEVPLAELLQGYFSSSSPPPPPAGPCFLSRHVTTRCGRARGVLTFTYECVQKEASWRAQLDDPVPLLEWLPSQSSPANSLGLSSGPPQGSRGDEPTSEPWVRHSHRPAMCSLLRWWGVRLAVGFAGWGLIREMILGMASEIASERIRRGCGHDLQPMVLVYGHPRQPRPPPPPPPPPSLATGLGLVVTALLLLVATRFVRDRLRIF